MQRQRIYTTQEKGSLERFAEHRCRCGEGGHHHE